MKKIFVLTLALVMALSLAACGGKDDPKPSGNTDPGTSQQTQQPSNAPGSGTDEPDETTDNPDNSQPSGEPDDASVEWPENEWTEIIPKAADTVVKIDENMSTGMGSAYVIYMDWTDEDALAYGRKVAETGVTAAAPEIIDGVFQMLYTDPDTGRMVQITELGEAEDDYVIVLYK